MLALFNTKNQKFTQILTAIGFFSLVWSQKTLDCIGSEESVECYSANDDLLCPVACGQSEFNPTPNFLGIQNNKSILYYGCIEEIWVSSSNCTTKEYPEDSSVFTCEGFTSPFMATNCSAAAPNTYCFFECNSGYISHPEFRYREMGKTSGKLACLDDGWMSVNPCQRECLEEEEPYLDMCICQPGFGIDRNSSSCKECPEGSFSEGLLECRACPYEDTVPNEDRSECVKLESSDAIICELKDGFSLEYLHIDFVMDFLRCFQDSQPLTPPTYRTCYGTGELSFVSRCSKKCNSSIRNAELHTDQESIGHNETVNFTCSVNYGVNGNLSVVNGSTTCLFDGIWSGEMRCSLLWTISVLQELILLLIAISLTL